MTLERFQVDDLLHISPAPPQRYPGAIASLQAEKGMALTLWNGNVAIGAAGITQWKLCDEAWAYLSSELIYSRPLVLMRLVTIHLPFFARVLRTQQLIARIQPGVPRHARWTEALGMKFAGIDEDGWMQYRRTF